MIDKKPADDATRQAIRSRLDVTMLVEAAAGTGKTTSLVARVGNSGRRRGNRAACVAWRNAAAGIAACHATILRGRLLNPLSGDFSAVPAAYCIDQPAKKTALALSQPGRQSVGGGVVDPAYKVKRTEWSG